MLRRILLILLITTTASAQTAADLEKRLDEMKRQIDILTQQIETMKLNEQQHVAQADVSQFGLGAAASKAYRSEPGVSFGGYGEFLYQNPRHGLPTADVARSEEHTSELQSRFDIVCRF